MRKLFLATILTGFMGASVALAIPSSGTISAVQTPGLSFGSGGEFTATVPGFNPFQTFCIEIDHEFDSSKVYDYQLGQSTHGAPPSSSLNYLSLGTAFLFAGWVDGTYVLPNDGTGKVGLNALVGSFQNALWYFQGQIALPSGDSNALAFINDAISNLGSSVWDPSKGTYGIQVVETSLPVGATGDPGQDWLTVPDSGATVILLGLGLTGLVLVSRRLGIAR